MPQHAWEIVPTLYTDENGVEQISYENPQISNSAVREAGMELHRQNEADYVTTDNLGRSRHDFDHLEVDDYGAILNHSTGEYIETPESEQYLNGPDTERRDIDAEDWDVFVDNFYEDVGGEDAFDNLIDWANDNVDDDDFIDGFNDAIDDGDIESFLEHYEILVSLYNEQH